MPEKLTQAVSAVSDILGYLVTVILTAMWWDVRKVRKLKSVIIEDVEKKVDGELARVDKRLDEGRIKFLTREKHQDLCTIASLTISTTLTTIIREEVKASEKRILKAINGGISRGNPD